MRRAGLLETMASGDLEAVTRAVGRGYRSGSFERLVGAGPCMARGDGARGARGGDALRRALRGGRDAPPLAGGRRRALPRVGAGQRRAGRGCDAGARARARRGRVALVASGATQAGAGQQRPEAPVAVSDRLASELRTRCRSAATGGCAGAAPSCPGAVLVRLGPGGGRRLRPLRSRLPAARTSGVPRVWRRIRLMRLDRGLRGRPLGRPAARARSAPGTIGRVAA